MTLECVERSEELLHSKSYFLVDDTPEATRLVTAATGIV